MSRPGLIRCVLQCRQRAMRLRLLFSPLHTRIPLRIIMDLFATLTHILHTYLPDKRYFIEMFAVPRINIANEMVLKGHSVYYNSHNLNAFP